MESLSQDVINKSVLKHFYPLLHSEKKWTLLLGFGNKDPQDREYLSRSITTAREIQRPLLSITQQCGYVDPMEIRTKQGIPVFSLCLDLNRLSDLEKLLVIQRKGGYPIDLIVLDHSVNKFLNWTLEHLKILYRILPPTGGQLLLDQSVYTGMIFVSFEEMKEWFVKYNDSSFRIDQHKVVVNPNEYASHTIKFAFAKPQLEGFDQWRLIMHNMKLVREAGFQTKLGKAPYPFRPNQRIHCRHQTASFIMRCRTFSFFSF